MDPPDPRRVLKLRRRRGMLAVVRRARRSASWRRFVVLAVLHGAILGPPRAAPSTSTTPSACSR